MTEWELAPCCYSHKAVEASSVFLLVSSVTGCELAVCMTETSVRDVGIIGCVLVLFWNVLLDCLVPNVSFAVQCPFQDKCCRV